MHMYMCVSVFTADGETDVGVLGPQSGLAPHSPEGEEDAGEDVRDPRHQTVTASGERQSRQPRRISTSADRRRGEGKKASV